MEELKFGWVTWTACVSSVCVALVACGGSSESAFDDTNADAGENGSSGGSAGSTSSGGSAMGGSGGSSSSTTGATTASGGSAGATSGAMNPVPPPGLVQGCASLCMAAQEADCPNEETPEDCAQTCNVLTRVPECNDALDALFTCAQDSELSCDADGEATVTGCAAEELAAFSCVLNEAPDPDMIEVCEDYCSLQLSAMCENETETEEDCVLGCASIGTILPECKPQWQNLIDCGVENGVECDEAGDAQAIGCDAEGLLALACLLESTEEEPAP